MTGSSTLTALLERWRADLDAWRIPQPILDAAPRSPWTPHRATFVRRAEAQLARPEGPSYERAAEALADALHHPEAGGTILDVGAGAGAASLSLAPPAAEITAVDTDPGMLGAMATLARDRGVPVHSVVGVWPEVADRVVPADVVTCHHVLYNVPDLEPFVMALTAHARRRVVVELTPRHPLTALNPLWVRLYGLERPDGPASDDVLAILRALGLEPRAEAWVRPTTTEYGSFAELVEDTSRRLCIPPERTAEVEVALRDLGVDPRGPVILGPPTRDLVTIWWDGHALY